MANALLTPQAITKEACYLLENKLVFTKQLDNRSKDFAGGKTGKTLEIRKPINLQTVQANDVTPSIRDIIEDKVLLTIDDAPISIAFVVDATDKQLSLQDFSNRILVPAMESLASTIELEVFKRVINKVNNAVNSASFDFAATSTIRTRMNEKLAPSSRSMVLTSGQSATLRNDSKDLQTAPKGVFSEGAITNIAGMDLFESELLPVFVTGSRVADNAGNVLAANVTNGATSLSLTLTAQLTIKPGELITIKTLKNYNVNYYSKETKTTEYQFCVVPPADPTVDSGNWVAASQHYAATAVTFACVVNISEAAYGPAATGFRQKMSRLPQAAEQVVFVGAASTVAAPQGFIFSPQVASIAWLPLEVMEDKKGASETYKGINLLYQKEGSVGLNRELHRIHGQFGVAVVQPEYGCRFISIA